MSENEFTRYENDSWTLTDSFGMARLAVQVARVALAAQPPFALRVTGKWGAGKTSIMRYAFATLGGAPIAQALPIGVDKPRKTQDSEQWNNLAADVRKDLNWDQTLRQRRVQSLPIWYSPWQHQNAPNPLVPLLLEIRNQLSGWMKFKNILNEGSRSFVLAAMSLLEKAADTAIGLTSGKFGNFFSGTTQQILKVAEDNRPKHLDLSDGQRFHLLFEDAVDQALVAVNEALGLKEKGVHSRLIIFIDDLDRCEESVVVSLLESIKLYLNTQNCVFVFGMDNTAILGALERHWPNRSPNDNREYLEKLFQVTLAVPAPNTKKVQTFVQEQLKCHGIHDFEEMAKNILYLLEPNPRKIKNFTNSICAAWGTLNLDPKGKFSKKFLLFLYLRQFHDPIWRLLERERWTIQVLRHVLAETEGVLKIKDVDEPERQTAEAIRVLMEHHFLHVLGKLENPDSPVKRYRDMDLKDAVSHILKNIDQKRSDTYFKKLFIDEISDSYTELEDCMLILEEIGG